MRPNPGKGPNLIFLAGSNRSGTTWLEQIIANSFGYREYFEPLHHKVCGHREFTRKYLASGEPCPDLETHLENVLSGKLKNRWMNQAAHGSVAYFYKNRFWLPRKLVKIIRGNMMLPWIERRFDAKIIFIIRHPCAVIASLLKLGWDRNFHISLSAMQNDKNMIRNCLGSYREYLFIKNPSVEQILATVWAVENKIPLSQIIPRNWAALTYEDLYASPAAGLDLLAEKLGLPRSRKSYQGIHKVTNTAIIDKGPLNSDPLKKWQSQLSDAQVSCIMDVIKNFDIPLYGPGVMPNASAATRLGLLQP